jgi:hypothetical protein
MSQPQGDVDGTSGTADDSTSGEHWVRAPRLYLGRLPDVNRARGTSVQLLIVESVRWSLLRPAIGVVDVLS